MKHNMWLIVLVVFFTLFALLGGCSGGDSTMPESPAVDEAQADEPAVEEAAEEVQRDDEDEVLFDFYSTPSDWPRAVPSVMNEFKVTRYERTANGMQASGYGDLQISRANNFYMNARKETGTSFNWEFDSSRESITEGSEQIFYYIDDEGKSLVIKLKELEPNKIEFELDFQE